MIRETNITVQHGDTVNLLTPSGVRVGHWVFGKVARRDERATVIYRWVLFALLLALAVAMGFNIGRTLSEFLTIKQARSAGIAVGLLAFASLYTAWMLHWKHFASTLCGGGSFSWRQEASDFNPPPPAPPAPPTTGKDEKWCLEGVRGSEKID